MFNDAIYSTGLHYVPGESSRLWDNTDLEEIEEDVSQSKGLNLQLIIIEDIKTRTEILQDFTEIMDETWNYAPRSNLDKKN